MKAIAGHGKRGSDAEVAVRADDTPVNQVRLHISISGHGRTLFDGPSDFVTVGWGHVAYFSTTTALPSSAHPGRFRVCVTAWDHAGNKSKRTCAPYTVS